MSDYTHGFSQAECYFLINALLKSRGGKDRIPAAVLSSIPPTTTITWNIDKKTGDLYIEARDVIDKQIWDSNVTFAKEP